jgi:hypothetical protein
MAQLLAAPVLLEPVVEAPLEALDVVDALLDAESVLGLSALLLSVLLLPLELLSEPSAGFFAPLLLYRSAYHPPPLRMKPAPPDT